jgi:Flp pilus assembly pilin Flp
MNTRMTGEAMLVTAPSELVVQSRSKFRNLVQKTKVALQNFDKDEQGMNTVEAIILLFVAAIVLLVFFALIWPLIRESVVEQLNNLFGQTGQ